jgi:6-phosphogluconate dehydrogenase
MSRIGLVGLAVMGQNLALNIAEKGFTISVFNRSSAKTDATVKRAQDEKLADKLTGYHEMADFVASLSKPRAIIMLVKAGAPVDATLAKLKDFLEPGDLIIDGGNEWYRNTERRAREMAEKQIMYMGMGVSGGEEGARNGPSLMPGGPPEAYAIVEDVLRKIAAQVDDGPCVTHIGLRGAGNYVKMVHNGIEYGDMQLIAEAYDVLKNVGGLSNDELAATFSDWNNGELDSFLIEITAQIFRKKDEDGTSYLVDKVLDKTGSKGTGRMTVQEAAEQGIAAPTISAALDARYLSSLLEERKAASGILAGPDVKQADVDKSELVDTVRKALYAAKICSYAQGMNLIRAAGKVEEWDLNLGAISRIWKGGCIIRAKFLDRIKAAYDRDANLASLLVDQEFAAELKERQASLRKLVTLAISVGVSVPSFSGSLAYYDQYRRARLPANLTQAQRDFFGAHTYERVDKAGVFHSEWGKE